MNLRILVLGLMIILIGNNIGVHDFGRFCMLGIQFVFEFEFKVGFLIWICQLGELQKSYFGSEIVYLVHFARVSLASFRISLAHLLCYSFGALVCFKLVRLARSLLRVSLVSLKLVRFYLKHLFVGNLRFAYHNKQRAHKVGDWWKLWCDSTYFL